MHAVGGEEKTPRPVTFALPGNHALWEVSYVDGFYTLLAESLPQVDAGKLISRDEVAKFSNGKRRRFPKIQRSLSFAARFPGGAGALLLGDASHAFPPDLGQGINCAFDDVLVLQKVMAAFPEDASIGDVFGRFESLRVEDIDALLDMYRYGFQFQYGQVLRKLYLGFLRVMLLMKQDD